MDPVTKADEGTYVTYTSNKAGLRFKKETGNFNSSENSENSPNIIKINPNQTYNDFFGFGGAFTDSFGVNVLSLSKTLQKALMRCVNCLFHF